ncbi:hypothetical protein GWI33_004631 [Rhynchophorus ferrugineus]|uniref:Uncharacterized protein n=1 Tax=Rhynchophorus ferrugineus TaxID=354439 RepID=A0A834ML56_RHYFE|nr:hypothetical protein GWI33_004631 [Rhynchophorus ferrugineus]
MRRTENETRRENMEISEQTPLEVRFQQTSITTDDDMNKRRQPLAEIPAGPHTSSRPGPVDLPRPLSTPRPPPTAPLASAAAPSRARLSPLNKFAVRLL